MTITSLAIILVKFFTFEAFATVPDICSFKILETKGWRVRTVMHGEYWFMSYTKRCVEHSETDIIHLFPSNTDVVKPSESAKS